MSYIDTINHSHVGNFAGLPVYHPLENLDEEKQHEFSATPNNLVIGGGGGEHPGMVVKNLDACVWHFLNFNVDVAKKDTEEIDFFKKWEDQLGDSYYEDYYSKFNLEYNSWSMDTIKSFVLQVEKIYDQSTQYYQHKKELRNQSVEYKINVMIGEFLYFSGQKLLSPELREYIKDVPKVFEKNEMYIESPFNSVVVPPKGYPVSGRSIVPDDTQDNPTGKVKCGLRFDEEHLIDPVLNDPDRYKKSKKMKM